MSIYRFQKLFNYSIEYERLIIKILNKRNCMSEIINLIFEYIPRKNNFKYNLELKPLRDRCMYEYEKILYRGRNIYEDWNLEVDEFSPMVKLQNRVIDLREKNIDYEILINCSLMKNMENELSGFIYYKLRMYKKPNRLRKYKYECFNLTHFIKILRNKEVEMNISDNIFRRYDVFKNKIVPEFHNSIFSIPS